MIVNEVNNHDIEKFNHDFILKNVRNPLDQFGGIA